MNNFTSIFAGTPIWIYIILIYLLYVGVEAIKPHTIWLPKLFIIPTFITISLIKYVCTRPYIEIKQYGLSFVISIILSWFIFRRTKLICSKSTNSITLPGSYITLMVLISICLLHYFWKYMEAVHATTLPAYLQDLKIISSGVISGLMIGRSIAYLYKFMHTK